MSDSSDSVAKGGGGGGFTSRFRWGGGASTPPPSEPKRSSSANFNEPQEETAEVDESNIATNFVPESEKSSFVAFVKRAMGGIDLSKIAAPPFILSPFSILETNSDLMGHPENFCSIAQEDTPLKRFIQYTKWYISRYHKQSTTGSGKKPYNPILGERFLCHWENPKYGKLSLISEQVSHHPPFLAEYYENRELGIVNMSHFGLKSNFAGTIVKAKVEAHNWTRLVKEEEDYVCTFPTFIIRGFLVANPFFDAVGDVLLHSTPSDYKAVLEYKDKPWFRGEYHQITGRIFHGANPSETLYTISGNWKKVVHITENATGNKEVLFDCDSELSDRIVAPIDQQHEMESQKVWQKVTEALLEYNYSVAGQAKHELEERQRELARERAASGEAFQHNYFYFDEGSERWLLKDYENRFDDLVKEMEAKK